MKKLSEILSDVEVLRKIGPDDPVIREICFDSRKVSPGSLFIAVRGTLTDGHMFIEDAIISGASAIICETAPEILREDVSYILVENSSDSLGRAASGFYGRPSDELKVIGVTGTNGKTTIATLLHRVFRKMGFKTGLLSTVENLIVDKEIFATHTTPDAVQINKLFREMLDQGCTCCFMEVSSHAIHQKRISGILFAGGIFSNISHDHLDYHKTFRDYLNTKKAFFDELPVSAFSLVNNDDKNGHVMTQNCHARKLTYSIRTISDFKGKIMESRLDGMEMQIEGRDIWTGLVGEFNAYNLMAVYAASVLLDCDKEEILKAISSMVSVTGRFETIPLPRNITAILDYAHTPDALENVLQTIHQISSRGTRIITVVGAGGNRDKTKRPIMGKVAASHSDKLILTSDNPRFEKAEDIIREMLMGISEENRKSVLSVPDRKEAIRTAFMLASKGDIILVAGKGHETYQEIEGEKYHFDDREVIQSLTG